MDNDKDRVVSPDALKFNTGTSFDSGFPTNQDSLGVPIATASTSYMNASKPQPQTNSSMKTHLVVLTVLAILVLVVGIAIAIVYLINNSDDSSDTQMASENSAVSNTESISTTFKNLTKDEAMSFLQSRKDGIDGILPEGYVGEEITNSIVMSGRNTIRSGLNLIYSYDDLTEVEQEARQRYYSAFPWNDKASQIENDFEIKEYAYYAIVTPNFVKNGTECNHGYNTCNSLLSFKRSHLNYLSEEVSPNVHKDAFYMNTNDPEIINELLRVYSFFMQIGFGGRGNIYSYSFAEQDGQFVLTVNYITVGLNTEAIAYPDRYTGADADKLGAYAINLFSRRYAVDESDSHVYNIPVKTDPEVQYSDYIKSFPITQEEMSLLLGYDN